MAACGRHSQRRKNIETLIADGGDITIGMIAGIECGVTAADGHNAVAMLAGREGKTISALLRRLESTGPSSIGTRTTWIP